VGSEFVRESGEMIKCHHYGIVDGAEAELAEACEVNDPLLKVRK
jgi:hypothetical protein